MRVELAYGSGVVAVEVPDGAEVVRSTELPALANPAKMLTDAFRHPQVGQSLPELIRPGARVVVVFPDITRPMPNRVVLPALLGELANLGAGPDDVILLCATGTHRPATPEQMQALVGPQVFGSYRIHQHDATDADHVDVGRVGQTPVLLDRRYVEADVRIVTGFVEPHFFAGFSGGPKAVCPGVASLDTILEAHSPERIAASQATWLELDENPVHSFIRKATALLPPDLSVDVAINNAREITAIFVGALPDAHLAACDFVRHSAVHTVPTAYDVVVTSNAGLPLDRNLYQAVKGMAAAERIVQPGGHIVMVSSCIDGFPDGGAFARVVQSSPSASALGGPHPKASLDLWQAQVLGRVLARATVHLFTEGLSAHQVRSAHLTPVADPSRAVAEIMAARGTEATICVLPDGPLTVATLDDGTYSWK